MAPGSGTVDLRGSFTRFPPLTGSAGREQGATSQTQRSCARSAAPCPSLATSFRQQQWPPRPGRRPAGPVTLTRGSLDLLGRLLAGVAVDGAPHSSADVSSTVPKLPRCCCRPEGRSGGGAASAVSCCYPADTIAWLARALRTIWARSKHAHQSRCLPGLCRCTATAAAAPQRPPPHARPPRTWTRAGRCRGRCSRQGSEHTGAVSNCALPSAPPLAQWLLATVHFLRRRHQLPITPCPAPPPHLLLLPLGCAATGRAEVAKAAAHSAAPAAKRGSQCRTPLPAEPLVLGAASPPLPLLPPAAALQQVSAPCRCCCCCRLGAALSPNAPQRQA